MEQGWEQWTPPQDFRALVLTLCGVSVFLLIQWEYLLPLAFYNPSQFPGFSGGKPQIFVTLWTIFNTYGDKKEELVSCSLTLIPLTLVKLVFIKLKSFNVFILGIGWEVVSKYMKCNFWFLNTSFCPSLWSEVPEQALNSHSKNDSLVPPPFN